VLRTAIRAEELQRKQTEEARHQEELARVQSRLDGSAAELDAVRGFDLAI
jgi:hypothetical protein